MFCACLVGPVCISCVAALSVALCVCACRPAAHVPRAASAHTALLLLVSRSPPPLFRRPPPHRRCHTLPPRHVPRKCMCVCGVCLPVVCAWLHVRPVVRKCSIWMAGVGTPVIAGSATVHHFCLVLIDWLLHEKVCVCVFVAQAAHAHASVSTALRHDGSFLSGLARVVSSVRL